MILHTLILCLTVLLHISLLSESPIVPVPHAHDLPTTFSIMKYAEGYECIQATTHFTQAGLYFLQLLTNKELKTTDPSRWVDACKKTYSLLSRLHHQSNFWLTQLAVLPQKGITPSEKEWREISMLATNIANQEAFLSSSKIKNYSMLIAVTEAKILNENPTPFIARRIRTYAPPSRW